MNKLTRRTDWPGIADQARNDGKVQSCDEKNEVLNGEQGRARSLAITQPLLKRVIAGLNRNPLKKKRGDK